MKSTFFSINILIGIFLLSLASCKKYGYEFEDGYNKPGTPESEQTLDTSMNVIDRSLYTRARIFPGMVEASEPRVKDAKFTLDLDFSASNSYLLRISVAPRPQFSTGFYAPAGELIKIIVPQGADGLNIQVGGHTDDLTGQLNLKRDPLIYTVKQLYPGTNYIRNPYGGTIYINAAFGIKEPVEFTITGAVKSPDFVLGKSIDSEWIKEVRASTVPWLELRSMRVIFLIPRDFLIRNFDSSKPLTNPTALMTAWNTVFEEDFNGWMGLSDFSIDNRDRSPQGPWREVLDIQPSVGYGHNGFPTVATMDDEWFNSVVSLEQLLHGANWGTYHEFGHNCQQGSIWSWSTLGETTNNLFNYKVAHRNGASFAIQHGDEWVQPALDFVAANTSLSAFDTDKKMDDPFKRMIPFLQIFGIYGYEAMPYLYTEARHAARYSISDIDKHDFVYERFSEYANTDLKLFFEAWGIAISSQSRSKISAKFPGLTKKIWAYNPMTKSGGNDPILYKTTISASSEQESGEPAPSGPAAAMLDGLDNTFWHTKWSGDNYPFTIILNTGAPVMAKGLYFVTRNSTAQRPKNAEIYTSNDQVTWNLVGSTVITNAFARYNYNFPATLTAQYYKVILKDSWTGQEWAALSELNVIK
ncbi:MAG TPA: M60 family metallopeptidase [Pedobacter sp.]|uniref:M60 family metallopeptidase n=1 Tax=Pedobacter sp. TaxID=1411316 RepID=UPI002C986BCB|nr:M60 family metallopeptidase [Pedobacter sp.]HMI04428.1 M60 family metallopeptidase [Pedobacter sp.]